MNGDGFIDNALFNFIIFKKVINNSVGVDNSGIEKSGLDYWLKGSAAGAQGAGEAGKSSLAGKLEMWLTADE